MCVLSKGDKEMHVMVKFYCDLRLYDIVAMIYTTEKIMLKAVSIH